MPQGPVVPEEPGVTCVHGSPLNEDQYILNMRDAWAPLQQAATAITFFGHTHLQGGFSQKDHEWHEIKTQFVGLDRAAAAMQLQVVIGKERLAGPCHAVTDVFGGNHFVDQIIGQRLPGVDAP